MGPDQQPRLGALKSAVVNSAIYGALQPWLGALKSTVVNGAIYGASKASRPIPKQITCELAL